MAEKSLFEKSVHKCFELTIVFDLFRKVLHGNFFREKGILGKELDLKKRTLDFGCGSGPYSVIFEKTSYMGADVDEKNIKFARKKYDKEFILLNGKDLRNINEKQEQIFAVDVFHHLPDEIVKRCVKEFAKILAKRGKVVILEHTPVNMQTNLLGKMLMTFDRGKNIRSKEELNKFFDKAFVCEKTYEYYAAGVRDYLLVLRKK